MARGVSGSSVAESEAADLSEPLKDFLKVRFNALWGLLDAVLFVEGLRSMMIAEDYSAPAGARLQIVEF